MRGWVRAGVRRLAYGRAAWRLAAGAVMALGALCLARGACADQWDRPPSEYPSDTGRFILRVDVDKRTLALEEKTERGRVARWSVRYPDTGAEYGHPAPVAAYITGDGKHVVLRDVWGRVGYGKVLIFLGPSGNVLASYTLAQLLTEDEIYKYDLSVSSLWWSKDGLFFFRPGQTEFALITKQGTVLAFALATGQMLQLSPGQEREIRSQALAIARKRLFSAEPADRRTGATMVGVLGDKESVPRLKQLLEDWTYRGTRNSYPFYEVHVAAGEALAALLGAKAAPLLEGKLPKANPQMAQEWARLLGQIGAARDSPGVKRLSRSGDGTTRLVAVQAMLEGDDGTVIHQHLGWLHDRDERVRAQALIALVNHVRAGDAKALRAALDDRDASCAEWALRGLVQLNPPDIDDVLHKALRRRPYLSSEATLHLARRGDRDALSQIVLWVQGLSKGIPRGAGWGLFEVDEMCQILVERRPPGTEAALRAASSNSRSRVQRDVFGALAVLGDTSALTRLRALARTGGVVDRAHAIRWLGICKDRGSLDFLREALEDREPIVRDAAREALKGMAR